MNPNIQTIQWPTPGGMYIPEHEEVVAAEPAILALRGGRSKLVDILKFDAENPMMSIRTRTQPKPFELSCAYLQWMRLINPVQLLRFGSRTVHSDNEWQSLLKLVELHFKSGEILTGPAPALMHNDRGWFIFLAERVGMVSRYFVPHRSVLELRVNGELQVRGELGESVVREMKNPRLAELVKEHPDLYPWALEAQYPRILQRIMDAWDNPQRARAMFAELLVDVRGGRQGFPREVAHDLFRLSETYDSFMGGDSDSGSPWDEEVMREHAEGGINYSPVAIIAAEADRKAAAFAPAAPEPNAPPEESRDENGWTALMSALVHGNEREAEDLLQRGADPYVVDSGGYMPLHWAAYHGYEHLVQLLINRRVPINAVNRYGWTPLLQAAAQGHAGVCEQLIAAGALVALADSEGWTPLHKAVANGHRAVVEMLLRHGADVRAQHVSGQTPAGLALQHGYQDIYDTLLQKFDVETRIPQDGAIDYRP